MKFPLVIIVQIVSIILNDVLSCRGRALALVFSLLEYPEQYVAPPYLDIL